MRHILSKLAMIDSPEFADDSLRQKLYFYLISNFLGIFVMIGFGVILTFKGKYLIPITDFVGSALLLFAYIYLLISKKLHNACILAAIAFIGFLWIHLFTGGTDSSGPIWFFVFPPVALYLLGLRFGLMFTLIAIAPAITILIMLLTGSQVAGYATTFIIRFIISYLTVTFLFYIMESQRTKAQKEVKVLSGLLPICSSCKNIRDDKGYWSQIEGYIQKHSNAQFSHSVCPKCAKKLYPDLDVKKYDILRKNDNEN